MKDTKAHKMLTLGEEDFDLEIYRGTRKVIKKHKRRRILLK